MYREIFSFPASDTVVSSFLADFLKMKKLLLFLQLAIWVVVNHRPHPQKISILRDMLLVVPNYPTTYLSNEPCCVFLKTQQEKTCDKHVRVASAP